MSYSGSSKSSDGTNIIGALIVIVLLFLCCLGGCAINAHREYDQTFTVTGKENVKSGNSGKYLVYTDKTTLEVSDTWIFWRFDSSDVYGRIQIGKTYTATLQGYRVPFLSWYQNILDPSEVTTEKK